MRDEFKLCLADIMSLWINLRDCKDNDTDQFRTARELELEVKKAFISFDKDTLESLLCFCNYNHEDGNFYHPDGDSFGQMLGRILSNEEEFAYFQNRIKEKSEEKQKCK